MSDIEKARGRIIKTASVDEDGSHHVWPKDLEVMLDALATVMVANRGRITSSLQGNAILREQERVFRTYS